MPVHPASLILALLLLLNAAWCLVLHRRLGRFLSQESALHGLVRELETVLERAQTAVEAIREESRALERRLELQRKLTRRRGEELARWCRIAERLARRPLPSVPPSRGGIGIAAAGGTAPAAEAVAGDGAAADKTPDTGGDAPAAAADRSCDREALLRALARLR